MTRQNGNSYSPNTRERAVRVVMEHRGEYASE
jgi:transposase